MSVLARERVCSHVYVSMCVVYTTKKRLVSPPVDTVKCYPPFLLTRSNRTFGLVACVCGCFCMMDTAPEANSGSPDCKPRWYKPRRRFLVRRVLAGLLTSPTDRPYLLSTFMFHDVIMTGVCKDKRIYNEFQMTPCNARRLKLLEMSSPRQTFIVER